MNSPLTDLIAGVRNKTACVLAVARQDGEELAALDRRILELAGMIELIGYAEQPDYKAVAWLRRYQNALVKWRMALEGR